MTDQEYESRRVALHQAAHDHKGYSDARKVVESAEIYLAFLIGKPQTSEQA